MKSLLKIASVIASQLEHALRPPRRFFLQLMTRLLNQLPDGYHQQPHQTFFIKHTNATQNKKKNTEQGCKRERKKHTINTAGAVSVITW